MRLGGLLFQPADPCVLAATIHIRLRNSHHLPLSQQQFGDFVDKGPEPHRCICHCCCLPGIVSKLLLEGDLGEELVSERPGRTLELGNREAAGELSRSEWQSFCQALS